MKRKKNEIKLCIKCDSIIKKVTDKDYRELNYYFCNNIDCSRCGLLTILFKIK